MLRRRPIIPILLLLLLAVMAFTATGCASIEAWLEGEPEAPPTTYTLSVEKSSEIYYSETDFLDGVKLIVTADDTGETSEVSIKDAAVSLSAYDKSNGDKYIEAEYNSMTTSFYVTFLFEDIVVEYLAGTGGTIDGLARQAVSVGGSTESVTAVPREGYAFERWSDGVTTATRNHTGVGNTPGQATRVWANFQRIRLTVTAYLTPDCSPTAEKSVFTVPYGGTLTNAPTALEQAGHTFSEWKTVGTEQSFSLTDTITADVAIYPVYTKNSYRVSFYCYSLNADASDIVLTKDSECFVEYGSAVKAADYPHQSDIEGYTFIRWARRGGSDAASSLQNVTQELEILSVMEKQSFTVTIDSNHTDANAFVNEITVLYGDTLRTPAVPTRTGYTFEGWVMADTTDAYDFASPVKSAFTIQATWAPKPTVYYQLNIYDKANEGTLVREVPYRENTLLGTPEALPDTASHIFCGFVDAEGYVVAPEFVMNADLDLYATWQIKTFSVSFVINTTAGVNLPNEQSIVVNYGRVLVAADLPDTAQENIVPSHDFIEWRIDSIDGEKYELSKPITADTTLYAVWRMKTYRVQVTSASYGVSTNFASDGILTVEYGDSVELIVTTQQGVTLLGSDIGGNETGYIYWTVNGITPSSHTAVVPVVNNGVRTYSHTFTNIRGNYSISFEAEKTEYAVTFNSDRNINAYNIASNSTGLADAAITGAPPAIDVYYNAHLNVSVAMNEGYRIADVTVNGNPIEHTERTFSLTGITINSNVVVTLEVDIMEVSFVFHDAVGNIVAYDRDNGEEANRYRLKYDGVYYYSGIKVGVEYDDYVEFFAATTDTTFASRYDIYVNGELTVPTMSSTKWTLYNITDDTDVVFVAKAE